MSPWIEQVTNYSMHSFVTIFHTVTGRHSTGIAATDNNHVVHAVR
ncbi:hypothetical protein NOR53_2487 [gamma proteobacterium NOR5-3]|nr:hypothetical protein NOR53_2487 [gamma proteobacterium NOR5-3]